MRAARPLLVLLLLLVLAACGRDNDSRDDADHRMHDRPMSGSPRQRSARAARRGVPVPRARTPLGETSPGAPGLCGWPGQAEMPARVG